MLHFWANQFSMVRWWFLLKLTALPYSLLRQRELGPQKKNNQIGMFLRKIKLQVNWGKNLQKCSTKRSLLDNETYKKVLTAYNVELRNSTRNWKNTYRTLQVIMQTCFPGSNIVPCGGRETTGVGDCGPVNPEETASNIVITMFTLPKAEWAMNSYETYKSQSEDGNFAALLQKGMRITAGVFDIHFDLCISKNRILQPLCTRLWKK